MMKMCAEDRASGCEDPKDAELTARVLGEYREMPGLALTIRQASRLWGCDVATCRKVIEALVARRALRWSDDRVVRP